MKTRRSIKVKLVAATAVLIAGGGVLAVMPNGNAAVNPQQIISALKTAYEVYKKLDNPQPELTLQAATDQIKSAIASARQDILSEIDQIAAADVQACATSAVINLADLDSMSPDTKMSFAGATLDCVTLAQGRIGAVDDLAAVNQMGYALNSVGPIALLARAHVGFETAALRSTLVDAGNSLVARLDPRCYAIPLWADAEPGGVVEVILKCEAFNGTVGEDSVGARIRRGQPLPPFDYSVAREVAMRGTSRELTLKTLLPVLTA
jgi:hypothetical protein